MNVFFDTQIKNMTLEFPSHRFLTRNLVSEVEIYRSSLEQELHMLFLVNSKQPAIIENHVMAYPCVVQFSS